MEGNIKPSKPKKSNKTSCLRGITDAIGLSSPSPDESDVDETTGNVETNTFIAKSKLSKTLKFPDETLWHYMFLLAQSGRDDVDFEFVMKAIKFVDINYTNDYGDNALHEACKLPSQSEKTLRVVKLLLENNIKRHHVNNYGQSILHLASFYDNVILIEYFLKQPHGIDLKLLESQTHGELQTPLHYASRNGSVNAIQLLVKVYKANIEAKDFQGRTPLYLAAEYGNSAAVSALIEQGAITDIKDYVGQKALYWIVVKCPDLAKKVLNAYEISESVSKRTYFHLHHIDIEPMDEGEGELKIPFNKSILKYIVESQQLDLITHPVIENLINAKWRDFGRIRSNFDFIITLITILVWHLLAVLVPTSDKHSYTLPFDWWRIFLFAIGILNIAYSIYKEVTQLQKSSLIFKEENKRRLELLEGYQRFCHPNDKAQMSFLRDERSQVAKEKINSYFRDVGNWYDILFIILLVLVISTHIADVCNHSDEMAMTHARIFSVTLIFISWRILSSAKVLYEAFGLLVVSIELIFKNVVVWFLVYAGIWIPLTSAFWMLFGYKKFDYYDDRSECIDVDTANTTVCAVVELTDFSTYNQAMYYTWIGTFGRPIEIDLMTQIDPIMSYILSIYFILINLLLLTNIAIAFLTSTFEKVQDSAKAYFLMQRAILITGFESEMSLKRRLQHLERLRKKYIKPIKNPILDRSDDNEADDEDDGKSKVEPILDSIGELKNKLSETKEHLVQLEEELDVKLNKLIEGQRMILNYENMTEKSTETRLKEIYVQLEQFKTAIAHQIGPNFSNV